MIESVSRRAFSGSSGTYNVHALELAAARERKLKGLNVTVRFLDDTEHVFHLEKRAKGAILLDLVYQHLELVEKDYFGLQFVEEGCVPTSRSSEWMRWLDPSKSLKKQLGSCQYPLHFRVKFYVSDPSKLQEEYTRYQFYLQLRRDILEERLILPLSTAILLASYTVQSELGDYQPEEHGPNYLSNLQLIPGQTEEIERKVSELHKLHKGQLPADAEFNFLDHAKRIEMYGVDLHKAKDNASKEIQIGVTHIGLVVFQNNIRINIFSWSKIMKISFKRKQFFIQLRREPSESYDTLLGFNMETYRSSKTLWKSCVEHHTFFRLHSPRIRRKFPLSLGSKFTYSGRTEFQTVSEVRQRGILERKFVRSPSKHLIKQTVQPPPTVEEKGKVLTAPTRPPGPYKVTSLDMRSPKKAWTEDSRISDDDGGFLEKTLEGPFSPGIAGRVMSYADEEPPSPTSNGLYDTPPYSESHSPTSQIVDDTVVTIILYPDEDGKYGFNIKGGTDLTVPILVSRVAPNTPADKCTPRLSEGDQMLQINGHDVSHALHQNVVKLIQEARVTNSGKLVLTVKPTPASPYQTAEDEHSAEEPPYRYVPCGEIQPSLSPGDVIRQSILLLADGLAGGQLLMNYETLLRKLPDMPCDEAAKPENVHKNRYRDISPYDATRVIINEPPMNGTDYINASHVVMSVKDTTLRYIAAQGPLPNTSADFWQMVWEQNGELVVMLTTLTERGRTKCHKYWPDKNEEANMGNVMVKCVEEVEEESFVFRDFVLIDIKTNETRAVKHMQYIAWPDHGVPDSPRDFLAFTEKVRKTRTGDAPVIAHCSAGVGRTGVLILMEAALKSIEIGEPVYPLDMVREMRRQRAMMVQNASQFRFVCESICAAYSEKLEEPEQGT